MIEVKAYPDQAAQQEGKALCVYKIGAQKGLAGPSFSTVGAGSSRGIAVGMSLSGITHATTGTAAACGISANKATYAGGMTLRG